MEEAPREKPVRMSLLPSKTMYSTAMPSAPRPTTHRPSTAPPEKATFSAEAMPSFAFCAVRTLARVALIMPLKPAATENSAPSRKHRAVWMFRISARKMNMTAAKAAITMYCRFR